MGFPGSSKRVMLRRIAYLVCGLLGFGVLSVIGQSPAMQPSLMENLGRGVVAVRSTTTEVFVGWRILGTDPSDIPFNLYRVTGGGSPVLLNGSPLSGATDFVDSTADLTQANSYFVRPILFGLEQAPSASFTLPANAPVQQFLRLPLQVPAPGTTPVGEAFSYSPNDCSVGDLDGDGEYEIIVKWEPSNAKDNSQAGYTGNVYLDAYKLDGTRFWRIDLGPNIRAGAHYTQFQVYDLDGDGRSEVACKTADGTIDGLGTVIGDANADHRNSAGYVLAGPEFLTIFDGQSGAALASASYVVPRGTVTAWGDDYGNRVDRFLAGVAYLDGQRPSLVMCRGYYTRTVVAAWNWRGGALTNLWTFDTGNNGTPNPHAAWRGQGNHQLSIGDVDADGKDEIMYGACAVDDNGVGLFSTGWGHGDALHMSDMDPDRPGMEVFQPHESPTSYGPNGGEFRDARTGALIFGVQASGDIGRGLALDVDPRFRGYEMWASGNTGGMYSAQQSTPNSVLGPRGVQIAANKPSINFGIWWDGDLLRELLDGTSITKWNWLAGNTTTLLAGAGVASNNGTKATPALSGDLLGDWREEVIFRESGNNALRIYTTTIPTTFRFYTMLHDRQYREAIAWQNTGYNQPPHPSFYFGDGMAPPPTPNIVTSLSTLLGPAAPVFTSIDNDAGFSATDYVTNDPTVVLHGTAAAATTVTVTRFGVGVIGTATTDGTGVWALDYTGTALPHGDSLFTATATDSSSQTGPPASPPLRISVDLIEPAAPTILDIADTGTLELTGTAEPGSVVGVTLVGTGVIGTTAVDAAGNWTLAYVGPPLAPGSHSFTAAAMDRAGNTGPSSAPSIVNTTVANPIIAAVSTDTGSGANDGITSDNTLQLSGTAATGNTVTVKLLGGAVLGTAIADGSGNWSFDHTATILADGEYIFSAAASNGSATSASSPPFPVKVDTVTPTVVSVNRQNPTAATSSSDSITFRVTFSESVAGVDAADFSPSFSGGLSGAISSVVPAGASVVDVSLTLSGEGSVRLDVNSGGTLISDVAGNQLAAGFATGQVYTRSLTGNATWIQSVSGGLWNTNPNWFNGIIGAGVGNTADFATLELVDDLLVRLDSPRTIGNLLFGDTDVSSPGSWIVDDAGNPSNILMLSASAGNPTITVNALGVGASAAIGASLAGNQGLTKLGPGTLLLTRPETLTGPITINGGVLRLGAGSSLNIGNNAVNLGANTQLNIAGGSFITSNQVQVVTSAVVVDSGSATMGNFRTNSDFGGTLRLNSGVLTCGDVNIRRNSAATPDFTSGFIVAGGTATTTTIFLGTNNSNGAMSIEGGSLTATGAITIGNQTTAGRGGAMRVLNGTFTSTDTTNGIVLARTNGANANNVATATFTGGVSTAEKFTLGFNNTVTLGSATITINGGTLYIGSGGIVKNGTAGLATNLTFGSGLLGAKASWSTSLPITLPTNGNIVLKAGDAADVARDLTFTGGVSGAGGFTKSGAGRLVLGGTNTFGGAVAVNEGALDVDGSLSSGSAIAINSGGTLTGDGTIGRSVTLNGGGKVMPGTTTPGSMLTAAAFNWNAGGALAFTLDKEANQLAITGALTKGGSGPHHFNFTGGPGLADGNSYTLVTFASTDLIADDLTFSGMPDGLTGAFTVTSSGIVFNVFVPCSITCPANIVQANDSGQCGSVVNYAAPQTVGACTSVSCTPPAGSTFPKGTTTVTCTTAAGPECSFTVTINDTEKPVLACPSNVSAATTAGQCSAPVTYPAPTVSDNCPGVGSPTCAPASGATFPKGTTTVNCSVSDASGNSANCSFTVTVMDTERPTIVCPAKVTAVTPLGASCVNVSYPSPVIADNCPGAAAACSPASGSCFPIGTTTVTCTATDASGNTASCSFAVTVFDLCVQDDSDSQVVLLINTTTGDYRFCCAGTVTSGRGTVIVRGSLVTLEHIQTTRRVTARVNTGAKQATATLASSPGNNLCVIRDTNITNNSCACQ